MKRALALLAVVSCGGLSARMRTSSTTSCPDVLAQQAAIRGDPHYASQPAPQRAAYELDVANCDLAAGKAQAALDLSEPWHDAVAVRRDSIRVRAEASLNHPDALREALETLAGETDLTADYFASTAELGPYSATEWFVPLAVQQWSRHPGAYSLQEFVSTLMHNAGAHLLGLPVAAADPDRPAGEWALWTGLVRDARIDRAGNRMLLEAQGVDIRDESDVKHHEVVTPNGKAFFVRYPHVKESLVGGQSFVALGRYAGRDGGGGPPVLDAIVVVERAQKPAQN
jgi:hypothetical protein